MGKKDTAINKWLGDKKRFADLFNGSVFRGEQVVHPDDLESDEREERELINDKNRNLVNVERNRDLVMKWNQDINLVVLACENQDKIHYAMPVRTMLYDGLGYAEQIRQLGKNRELKNPDEFLSGMQKEDKLFPILSVVLYYGDNEWDGSKELHELLQNSSDPKMQEIIKRVVPNYHINLMEINKIENLSLFKTDLQVVLGMLQYKENKNQIKQYITENEDYFKKVDADTYNVLRTFLGAEKQLEEIRTKESEEIDMCKALQDIYDDGKLEGRLEGERVGRLDVLFELVADGLLTIADAALKAFKTEEEFKEIMQKAGY